MALEVFSPAVRDWFRTSFEAPTRAQRDGWKAIAAGDHALDPRAHRFGQDARRVPVGDRPAVLRAAARGPAGEDARPLRVAAAGARRRHREEPPRAARRDPARRRSARHAARARAGGRDPQRRHACARPAADDPAPAGRPDHHAGVALPDAHVVRAGDAPERPDRHRRRDPRDGGVQARLAPRPVARAAGGALRRAPAADRSVRHAAARSRRSLGSSAARVDGVERPVTIVDAGHRKPMELQVVVPVEDMGGGIALDARAPRPRRRRRARTARQPGRSIWPSIHPALLELIRAHRSTIVFTNARRLAERLAASLNELAGGGPRARAPRLARARAAARGRGRPEGGAAPRDRRHVLARARHRHGRRGPRDPGGVPRLGRERAAADRPGRPPGGRAVAGPDLPQVPRRPAGGGGRGGADARRRDRAHALPAEPARRAGAAARRDVRGRGARRRRAPTTRSGARPRSRSSRRTSSSRSSTCSPGATRATGSRSCGRGSSGIEPPAPSGRATAPGRIAITSGGTIPDRGLFAVFLADGPFASASSTRRWSTRAGAAT